MEVDWEKRTTFLLLRRPSKSHFFIVSNAISSFSQPLMPTVGPLNTNMEMNMITDKVCLAVSGHTNTGKTTFIRTLIREPIGIVKDEANATKHSVEAFYSSIQAVFIDCPGFQNAVIFHKYLEIFKKNQEIARDLIKDIDITYDERALKGIDSADVVYYLVPLDRVPDDTFHHELRLILSRTEKIIGIINKEKDQRKILKSSEVDLRINQWKEFFASNNITRTVIFDSHWDAPSKADLLYSLTAELLSGDKKNDLYRGLESLRRSWDSRRYIISKKCADLIYYCRDLEVSESNTEYDLDNNETKLQIQRIINSDISNEFIEFFCDIAHIYKLSSDLNPKDISQKPSFNSVIDSGKVSKAVGGAVAGGVIGTVGGISVGVVIGGALGAIGGFFAGGSPRSYNWCQGRCCYWGTNRWN